MKKILKTLFKYSVLLSYGGMIYMTIELLYDGTTSVSMAYCGALAFCGVGLINNIFPWYLPIWLQSIVGSFFIITPLEYLFGILFNMDYSIWDYRNNFLNVNGFICLKFTLLWCLLSVVAIIVDDYMRYWLFDEEKPRYYI